MFFIDPEGLREIYRVVNKIGIDEGTGAIFQYTGIQVYNVPDIYAPVTNAQCAKIALNNFERCMFVAEDIGLDSICQGLSKLVPNKLASEGFGVACNTAKVADVQYCKDTYNDEKKRCTDIQCIKQSTIPFNEY